MKLKRPSPRILAGVSIILTIVVLAIVVPIGWHRYSEYQFEQEIRSVGGYFQVAKFERFSSVRLIKRTLLNAWSDLANGQLPGSTRKGAWANLYFYRTNVDDQWVQRNSAKIKGLPELELIFRKTRIGDLAIQSLEGADQIKTLDLSETQVTDQAIPAIASLSGLQSIDLRNTNVTGAGVAELIRKSWGFRLMIDGEDFTDEVVSAINNRPQGKGISFQLYHATDAHLKRLSQLNGPCYLDTIQGTELTERSLESVATLSVNYQWFTFLDTSFSQEALDRAIQIRGGGKFLQEQSPDVDSMWERAMRVKW